MSKFWIFVEIVENIKVISITHSTRSTWQRQQFLSLSADRHLIPEFQLSFKDIHFDWIFVLRNQCKTKPVWRLFYSPVGKYFFPLASSWLWVHYSVCLSVFHLFFKNIFHIFQTCSPRALESLSLTQLSLGLSPCGFLAQQGHDSLHHCLHQRWWMTIRLDLRHVCLIQRFQGLCAQRECNANSVNVISYGCWSG